MGNKNDIKIVIISVAAISLIGGIGLFYGAKYMDSNKKTNKTTEIKEVESTRIDTTKAYSNYVKNSKKKNNTIMMNVGFGKDVKVILGTDSYLHDEIEHVNNKSNNNLVPGTDFYTGKKITELGEIVDVFSIENESNAKILLYTNSKGEINLFSLTFFSTKLKGLENIIDVKQYNNKEHGWIIAKDIYGVSYNITKFIDDMLLKSEDVEFSSGQENNYNDEIYNVYKKNMLNRYDIINVEIKNDFIDKSVVKEAVLNYDGTIFAKLLEGNGVECAIPVIKDVKEYTFNFVRDKYLRTNINGLFDLNYFMVGNGSYGFLYGIDTEGRIKHYIDAKAFDKYPGYIIKEVYTGSLNKIIRMYSSEGIVYAVDIYGNHYNYNASETMKYLNQNTN